jgi:hypothetical protein
MTVSVIQMTDQFDDPLTQRAMQQLLASLQKDMAAMKAWQDTHTHTSTGATAVTTVPVAASPVLNTTP